VLDAEGYSLGVSECGRLSGTTDGDRDAEYRLTSCRGDTNVSIFLDESATEK